MPVNDGLLTREEKQALLAEHKAYIDDFNSHLPDNMKIPFDQAAFMAKLDDPEEVAHYRRSQLRQEKLEAQRRIYENLKAKHGQAREGKEFLARVIQYSLKTDGSDESNQYNEQLYQDFLNHPEKLLYQKLQALMNFNPSTLYESFGDKAALSDIYDANQALCEDAYAFDSLISQDAADWVNPEFKAAVNSMKKPFETLCEAKKAAYANVGSAYLTMPSLTPEQAMILMGSGPQYAGADAKFEVLNTVMNAVGKSAQIEQPMEYYDRLRSYGLNPNRNFFLSHVAEHRLPNGTIETVSFDELLKHPDDPSYNVRPRTEREIWRIRNVSKEFEGEYLALFQRKFQSNAHDNRPFDFARIKDANKGNVFERYLFRTSREYKNFIKAFEDFNNPASKDYLDKAKLRRAAEAYQAHKQAQGKSYEQMDQTSRGRTDLVQNVIDSLDFMEQREQEIRQQIEGKLYPLPGQAPTREPFLVESEVAEDSLTQDMQNVLNVIGPSQEKEEENEFGDVEIDDDALSM